MTILTLTAENVKRLSVVRIDATGQPVIVLAGENEAGKSSVLDAIEMALRGKKALPPRPVHAGASTAKVTLDMGDYIVVRSFTEAGGGTLTVKNREGLPYPSPQALLDKLIGDLTFDPMAFCDMTPNEQADTLRAVAGIDTTTLDATIAALFTERTDVARDVKFTMGALEAIDTYPDVDGPVDVAAVAAELDTLEAEAAALSPMERAVFQAEAELERHKHLVEKAARTKAERTAAFDEALDALERAKAHVEACGHAVQGAEVAETMAREAGNAAFLELKARRAEYAHASANVPDRGPLRAQLADAAELNRKAGQNARHATIAANLADLNARVENLTAQIEANRAAKAAALAAAAFPIEGLGLDEAGVTWQGIPFEQASTAVRLRISCAIGFALNPTLKVILVRNGNDLGPNNLLAIAEMAAANDAQVWIERIAGGDGLQTVVIEDGHVQGVAAPKPKVKVGPVKNVRAAVAAVREAAGKASTVSVTTFADMPSAEDHAAALLTAARDAAGIAESVADVLGSDDAPSTPNPTPVQTGLDDL